MEQDEIEKLKRMYNELAERLGELGAVTIKMKPNKDDEIVVSYNIAGAGEKKEKKTKKGKVEILKGKDVKPSKSILKKKDEKKATKWDQ